MQSLKNKYCDYSNIIEPLISKDTRFLLQRISKDILSTSVTCYGPSYLSFEYALSYYGLIPEHVSVFTSATYLKKNNKKYDLTEICFEYRGVPKEVFSKGVTYFLNEKGLKYKIATKEKALCDQLYSMYPVRSIKDLKVLLFEDLRIDEELFMQLDFKFIKEIADLYRSNTLYVLKKYIERFEIIKK